MFTPIKNLLTYIQKNASGSTLFGGSQSTSESQVSDEVSSLYPEKPFTESILESEKNSAMNGQIKAMFPNSESFPEDDVEQDIEKQISTNTILNAMRNITSTSIASLNKRLDHNQNHNDTQTMKAAISLRDESDDPLLLKDYHSIDSESGNRSIDMDHEDVFFDLTSEIIDDGVEDVEEILPTPITYHDREVVVLEDPELNTSLNADMCTEDPLAIEECNGNAMNSIDPNPLNSSNDGEILWINIDAIKRNVNVLPDVSVTEKLISPTIQNSKIPSTVNDEEQELPSDGSDSGLGSETSALLQTTTTTVADTSATSGNIVIDASSVENASALANENEMRFNSVEEFSQAIISPDIAPITAPKTVKKIQLRSNLKRHSNDDVLQEQQKRPKRSINFESVELYYFPRIQGFTCVPSVGGCTLGMGPRHVGSKTLTLAEHASEIRRAHRLQLQEINPRNSSTEESDSDEEGSEGSGSDLDADSNGFLQPVSPKQRRVLLKAAGIRKIDPSEKADCRDIRNSREFCGCSCRDFCDPDTCACSQAGIKCQVDRLLFPCGCSRDACGNVIGRVEFNPARVRTHFIHTIMRLDMESRHQKRPSDIMDLGGYNGIPMAATVSSADHLSTNVNSFHSVSNYASLDASPMLSYNQSQHNSYGTQFSGAYSTTAGLLVTPDAGQNHIQHYTGSAEQNHHYEYRDSLNAVVSSENFMDSAIFPTPTSYSDLLPVHCMTPRTNAPTTEISYHESNSENSSLSVAPVTTISSYSTYSNDITQQHDVAETFLTPYTSTVIETDFNATVQTVKTAITTNNSTDACIELKSNSSSFINLNTPVASSSRISAINDLLLNNRNTTATLVAISTSDNNSLANSSLNTPPIESVQNNLSFDDNNLSTPNPIHPISIEIPVSIATGALKNDINVIIDEKNKKEEEKKVKYTPSSETDSSQKSPELVETQRKSSESSSGIDKLLEDSVSVTPAVAASEFISKSTAIIELATA